MTADRSCVLVYGNPVPAELVEEIDRCGMAVAQPNRVSELPDVGLVGAVLVWLEPESFQDVVDVRACRMRVRSVLGDLARLSGAVPHVVLLVQLPPASSSDRIAKAVGSEMRRYARRQSPRFSVTAMTVTSPQDHRSTAETLREILSPTEGTTPDGPAVVRVVGGGGSL